MKNAPRTNHVYLTAGILFSVSLFSCTMKDDYTPLETPRLIDACRVSLLFGKPAAWFKRNRVRKALYARGFPRAVIRDRRSRSAVDTWLAYESRCPKNRPLGGPLCW
jgi:hypothetical protein